MGQTVAQVSDDILFGIDKIPSESNFPIYTDVETIPKEETDKADVIVDFSNVGFLPDILDFAVKNKKPIVIATTGLGEEENKKIEEAAQVIPVLVSSNMSLGINTLLKFLKPISNALGDGYDIEIIEKHHNRKKDAPSGTALSLAESLLEGNRYIEIGRNPSSGVRKKEEIGIQSLRGGTIPGEHSVIFAGDDEIVEIKHTALSRKIFANGAIEAAKFLSHQEPGLYEYAEVLEDE